MYTSTSGGHYFGKRCYVIYIRSDKIIGLYCSCFIYLFSWIIWLVIPLLETEHTVEEPWVHQIQDASNGWFHLVNPVGSFLNSSEPELLPYAIGLSHIITFLTHKQSHTLDLIYTLKQLRYDLGWSFLMDRLFLVSRVDQCHNSVVSLPQVSDEFSWSRGG